MLSPVGWRAVGLALAVLCVPSAYASESDEAERRLVIATELFARNEYEQALEQVRKARNLKDLEGDELKASLALWEGLLLLHLGKKEEFQTHLEVAFLLQPDVAIPGRMSPKIKQRVEEVRASVMKKFERPAAPPKPPTPVQPKTEVKPTPRPEPKPESVAELKPVVAPEPAPTASLPSAELARTGPSPVLPLVLGGVALGAGAAGAWFGLQSQDHVLRASGEREQISAYNTLVTAQDQALVANVAFAVAGTAALATVITLLVNR
ncbi:MAG: hypothetical protein RL653_473 [Pseudomonadota bacterium]